MSTASLLATLTKTLWINEDLKRSYKENWESLLDSAVKFVYPGHEKPLPIDHQ